MDLLKQSIFQAIDEASEELEKLSTDIWRNPELNFEEHHAHEILTNFLERKGFNVIKKFAIETGFKADLGSTENGPNIAVICEYDALPEIGHACGHNLIAEAGVAAGLGIKAAMEKAEKPFGKITVLGTPAEEGGGGKIDMINAGVFDGIDVAMMVHPCPKTVSHVSFAAVDMVSIKYTGKAAHAASYPWEGVNALDAAVLCYQNVSCLRQQMKPTWRAHGIINKGGIKPNIIPEFTELEYYFRAPIKQELDELRDKMKSCFDSAATATGCQVSYSFSSKPYLNLVTNNRMADVFWSNAKSIGVKFDAKEDTIAGSTDMGNVSQIVPIIHPIYGIETLHGNHTKDFATAAGDPKAQLHTLNQAKAMALTCLDIFTDENLLKDIKDEFAMLNKNSK
ncbi:Peptidase M20 domain-containing protein 2 [Mytilus coruscus]|uniref:Peptidase M20 domain-containing protein 2 n=1 Tax=Mytilus coruscus TaxID=42192 RepID=A0A6J8DPE8_MYTCO|nr:Peptidase M20 domain-containing protein 2 [Mytilus coruscus]